MQIEVEPKTISTIVVDDYRTASIFEKHGLDFCCKGNRSIAEACREKGVDELELLQELASLSGDAPSSDSHIQFWSPDFLADFIIQNHHSFIRAVTPTMKAHVIKVASVHGEHHPEMVRVRDLFLSVSAELAQHMMKEEQVLFPYITALSRASAAGIPTPRPSFGSVENPIALMRQEHEAAGTALEEIRTITNNYALPEDACTTYKVTLEELAAYERDLHRHVHLENNILFPAAERLEQELRSTIA